MIFLEILYKTALQLIFHIHYLCPKFLDSNTFNVVFLCLVIIKGFAKNFITFVRISAK